MNTHWHSQVLFWTITSPWDPNLNSTSYIKPLPSLHYSLLHILLSSLPPVDIDRSDPSFGRPIEALVKMARVAMLLVAMVLVSCSVASAARVLQGQEVFQEEKFKHGKHDHGHGHEHPHPKLPSFPKPELPKFKLPGCPPPPEDTYESPPYTPSWSPPSPTYSPTWSPPPSPTYESPSYSPPPAGGY